MGGSGPPKPRIIINEGHAREQKEEKLERAPSFR